MDWRNVKKFVVGEPYDAEVEYLESNGTQTLSIPNLYPTHNVIDVQVTGGVNQTIVAVGAANRTRKVWTNANGEYAVFGTSSGDASFGISGSLRKTIEISIPRSTGISIEATIDGVTKTGRVSRASSVSRFAVFGNSTLGFGTLRLYGIDHYKLVRVGQVGCLYDPETGNFIYPTTGTLACGPDVRVIQRQEVVKITSSDYPLVLGAKRVEYLQGDCVHNWIDTGVQVSGLIDMELKMGFNADSNHYGASPTQYPDDPELYRGYTWLVQPYGTGTRLRLRTSGPNTYRNYVDSSNVWSVDVPHTLKISQTDKTLQVDGATVLTNVGQNATAVNNYIALCNSRSASGSVGGGNTESVCRLYYCKIWQGGTLVRDFVPIKVGTEGCLYDKVTGTVYHNPGTVPFICGAEVAETVLWKKAVPYDSEVEYLESTGTQYIDTGIYPADGLSFDLEAALMTNSSALTYSLFGGRNRMGGSDGQCSWWNTADFYFYGWGNNNDSGGRVTRNFTVGTQYAFHVDKTGITIDGTRQTTFTQQTAPTETDYPIYLFNSNNGGTLDTRVGNFRVYGFTIKNNGVTVRDFRPVRVGTTGYLFDRISWTLFGNAGTGSFGYGADVPAARAQSRADLAVIAEAMGVEDADAKVAAGATRLAVRMTPGGKKERYLQ